MGVLNDNGEWGGLPRDLPPTVPDGDKGDKRAATAVAAAGERGEPCNRAALIECGGDWGGEGEGEDPLGTTKVGRGADILTLRARSIEKIN
jgi:hypothetical protein